LPAALPAGGLAGAGAVASGVASAHGSLSVPVAAAVDFGIGFSAGVAGERLINGPSNNSESSPEPTIAVWRGVPEGHPGFDNALNGIAVPRGWPGGHANPVAHNAGDTNSIYTSWTEDYFYALD